MKMPRTFLFKIEKDVFCLLFGSSFCAFSISLWYNFFVLFLKDIGFTEIQIGTLLFLISLSGFFFSVIGGVLADLTGRKKVLILTTFLLALVPLFLLMKNFLGVLTAIVLYSFGSFGRRAAGRVLMGEKFPKEHLGKGMGMYFTLLSIVAAPASLVGGSLVEISYGILFLTASLLSFISLIPLLIVRETIKVRTGLTLRRFLKETREKIITSLSFSKALKYYYLLFCIYLFATELAVPFVPLYCSDIFGFDKIEIGLMYTLSSIISIGSFSLGGLIADKMGYVRTFVIALIINAILLGALPIAPNKLTFMVLFIISSFIFSIHEAPEASFIISQVPEDLRATTTATATMLQGVSTSFGPLLGGWIWASLSPAASFFIIPVIGIGAILLFGLPLTKQK